jgi:flagellar protein FlbD
VIGTPEFWVVKKESACGHAPPDPRGVVPGVERMILLTRLNNRPLVVNSDMIKFIENTPDTVITLVTGEKIVVLETVAEVMEEILNFRRRVVAAPGTIVRGADEAESEGLGR